MAEKLHKKLKAQSATRKTDESMESIYSLSKAIAQASEIKEIYELILDEVVRIFGVEKASIMVYDPDLDALKIAAARGLDIDIKNKAFVRVGEGISGKVFKSSEPLLIQDIQASGMDKGRDRYKTKSLMSAPVTCFPMKVGKQTLGVINVTDRASGKSFDATDLKVLTTLSNQVASYLRIVQLSREVASTEQLKQQLEIARQIQYRLLPVNPPNLEGIEAAGRVVTADRVGGDYYDFFISHSKRPSFAIADVSGHSIGAALTMAAFRSAIRAQMDSEFTTSILVQRINQILFEDLFQAEQFISMAFLKYMKARQLIQFTNAGHPPPIIWRSGLRKFEELYTDDPLLGIEPISIYHEKQVVVSKGDVVLLYTDGLTEAANTKGERFGKARLLNFLEPIMEKSAEEIVGEIVEQAASFADPAPIKDDITAMVLKIT
ncbi:MAG: GAF domain-containing SpoIIE family protein phosphatase [Pseudomonadota bacterium]